MSAKMILKKVFSNNKQRFIDEARTVLRGEQRSSASLNELCKRLETVEQYSYATDILLTRIEQDGKKGIPIGVVDYQTLAKYIYKDQSLPSSFKFDKALLQLMAHGHPGGADNCETYGLMGSIYKRKWQFDNQFKNLELSNYYYKKGYECWQCHLEEIQKKKSDPTVSLTNDLNDDGYTAINYAYLKELMAIVKLREFGSFVDLTEFSEDSLKIADHVRGFLLDKLLPGSDADSVESEHEEIHSDWILASIAEAFFGLRKYDKALIFIKKYFERENRIVTSENVKDSKEEELQKWKIKTFTQQMSSIAGLQLDLKKYVKNNSKNLLQDGVLKRVADEINREKIRICLKALGRNYSDPEEDEDKDSYNGSKCGLALSGGGFRAALFHIGVLASMAEHNKLKDLEVISCVSGGSIIGAFYYIELKNLLEFKTDDEITPGDYIKIVENIEIKFTEGVQKNLRMRIFGNLLKNVKMLSKNYSRSHRLGELYEEHFYKKIFREKRKKLLMRDLRIIPKDYRNDFSLEIENWRRINKIPQLILNATSVNTGHNWQFTASWMGEPPNYINDDIDVKSRLRRMYYADAPGIYKDFRLGYAVASSSCVPVMFEPMPMYDLYPGIDLQLIDGGLHDNQGIASLIEQECKNMTISDASGQLPSTTKAEGNEASLFFRADNILQERIREIQFMDLSERLQTSQITTLVKIHLKSGLKKNPVSWKNCTDPPRKLVYEKICPQDTDLTKYKVLRTVQEKLSELRTDLDSFNDVESFALMYSGYKQSNLEFCPEDKCETKNQWKFLAIEESMIIPEKSERIIPFLATGKKLTFKLIELCKPLKYIVIAFGFIALALIAGWVICNWDLIIVNPIYVKTLIRIVLISIALVFVGFISKPLAALLNIKGTVRKFAMVTFAIIVGVIVCNFYIIVLNPIYNRMGRIKEKFRNQ